MKKFINKYSFFGFIFGGIIFGSISAYAATVLSGSSIAYSNKDSGLESTNVQSAIDELYDKAIHPVTTATATQSQILAGQTAWVNGIKITGSMTNNGAKTATINPGGSYTIPAGYHNGSGKITAAANQNSGTYTFASGSTGAKVDLGANNTYRYVDATNVYNKGKADGVANSTPSISIWFELVDYANQYYFIHWTINGKSYKQWHTGDIYNGFSF